LDHADAGLQHKMGSQMIVVAFLAGGVAGTLGAIGILLFTDLGGGIALAAYLALGYGLPLAVLLATSKIKPWQDELRAADMARH
jgi:hypothetical protein